MIQTIDLIICLAIFLAGLGVGLLFHVYRARQTRRAFLAACDQRDQAIKERNQANMLLAQQVNQLGAARRLEMHRLAKIESLEKFKESQMGLIDFLQRKLGATLRNINTGLPLATARLGTTLQPFTRTTSRLSVAR
jgi:hypothetical protein